MDWGKLGTKTPVLQGDTASVFRDALLRYGEKSLCSGRPEQYRYFKERLSNTYKKITSYITEVLKNYGKILSKRPNY